MEDCWTIQRAKREYTLDEKDTFSKLAHILSTRHQCNGASRTQGIVWINCSESEKENKGQKRKKRFGFGLWIQKVGFVLTEFKVSSKFYVQRNSRFSDFKQHRVFCRRCLAEETPAHRTPELGKSEALRRRRKVAIQRHHFVGPFFPRLSCDG